MQLTAIFDKIVGTKLGRLSNYSPRSPGTVLKHQISFLGHWVQGTNIETRVGGGDHALREALALQTKNGEFRCMKILKITALQRSDFQILFQLILSKIVVQ